MISLAPNVSVCLMDRFGEGLDQAVLEWQDELLERVDKIVEKQVRK